MKQSILKSPLFLITIGLNSPLRSVVAWGHEGHAIIADVAYGQLSSSTQKAVTDILFPNSSSTYDKTKYASPLSAVASWADVVRYTEEFSWTSPLHFVDIRDDLIHGGCPSTSNNSSNSSSSNNKDSSECTFDYDRDCDNELCAVNAIQQLTTFLYNQTMPLSPPSTSTSISNSQQQNIFHQWQNTPALRSLRGTSTSVSHPINFTTRQSPQSSQWCTAWCC